MRVDSSQPAQSAVPAAASRREPAAGKTAFGAVLAHAASTPAASTEVKPGTGRTPAAATPVADPKPRAKVPAGEQYASVAGHRYEEIVAGPRNGMFINRSGNKRDGEAFVRVERGDRVFHIYGTGKNRLIVGMRIHHPAPAAATPATPLAAGSPATQLAPAGSTPAAATPPAVNGGTSAT
jgi:hypothetical protein